MLPLPDGVGINLTEFFTYMYFYINAWIEFARTLHPFSDFPAINLWNLFLSVVLVKLVMFFVPGLDEEEVQEDIDNNSSELMKDDYQDMENYIEDDFD